MLSKTHTLMCCALLFFGCSDDSSSNQDLGPAGDGQVGGDSQVPGDSQSTADTAPACAAVTITFTGEAATVAGNPLGLDSSARTAAVSGSFAYRPCLVDSKPQDPQRGEYDHGGGGGPFTLSVAGKTVTGSGNPVVKVEDLNPDTFRWLDGPQLLDKDKTKRQMSLDGTADPELKVSLSITDGSGAAFASDALPQSFPLLDIGSYTHTFSIKDGGGTLLLQLSSLTQS